jgi:hypothetical protein
MTGKIEEGKLTGDINLPGFPSVPYSGKKE